MDMADKTLTGLFPDASQDMTGNSNDNEQNLQLLKFRLIEPKRSVSEATHELHVENGALAKINHLRKERKENLAYLSIMLCSLC